MSLLTRSLREVGPGGRPLAILGVATHERVESALALCGHAHFIINHQGLKTWDATYAPVPPNYTLLPDGRIPVDVPFDLVLCQNRPAHFDYLKRVADRFRVPLLCMEHILPQPSWSPELRRRLASMRGDVNVFVSAYGRDEWGFDPSEGLVVENGIDVELFKPDDSYHRRDVVLAVANDWINRDHELGYKFWVSATRGLPVQVLGKTPGLSEPAASLEELAYAYKTASVFVNTARRSPIPTVLLEAMSSGCCVVSTRNPMLESFVVDGVNGYFIDTPEQMGSLCGDLLNDAERAREIGRAARETIVRRFGLPRFVEEWRAVFERTANVVLER